MLQTDAHSTTIGGGDLVGSVADFVMTTTSFTKMINKGGSGESNSLPKATQLLSSTDGTWTNNSFLPPSMTCSFLSFTHYFFLTTKQNVLFFFL